MKKFNNLEEFEETKRSFEPCTVEVVHFGEDIILTSGENSATNNEDENEEVENPGDIEGD